MRLARSMTESVVGGTVAAVFQRVTFGVPLIPPLPGSKVLSNAVHTRTLRAFQSVVNSVLLTHELNVSG